MEVGDRRNGRSGRSGSGGRNWRSGREVGVEGEGRGVMETQRSTARLAAKRGANQRLCKVRKGNEKDRQLKKRQRGRERERNCAGGKKKKK